MSRLPDPSLPSLHDFHAPADAHTCRADGPCEPGFPEPCPKSIWTSFGHTGEAEVWRKALPGTARQVADARRLTRAFLADTARAADAAWIVGELAANAVRHTRSGEDGGLYVVELSRLGEAARIVVYDLGGGGRPVFARPPTGLDLSEHGYGLRAIAQLAHRTGARGNPTTGHAVWAELLIDG